MIRILTLPFRLVLKLVMLPVKLVFALLKVVLALLWLVPKTILRLAWFFPKTFFRSVRAMGIVGLLALGAGVGIGYLLGSRQSSPSA